LSPAIGFLLSFNHVLLLLTILKNDANKIASENRAEYKNENAKDEQSKDAEHFQPFPLYVMLTCGIIIFIIGLYMFFSNTSTHGLVTPRYGGSKDVIINWKGAIMLGLGICVFPVYQFIRKRNK